MSASREKKQRQNAAGLSQRDLQAQKEAAVKRRNVIIYSIVGAVCVVLVAALLIWHSNFFQRRTTAVTVGDTKYNVADLSYYYYSAYSSEYMMAYYGYSDFDYTSDPREQTYDEESGQTYHDYFMEQAMESLTELTGYYNAAVAEGYRASDVRDEVDSAMDSARSTASTNGYANLAQYLLAQYGEYMDEGSYRTILERVYVANAFVSDHREEVSASYTEEDLETYYQENKDSLDTFSYSYLVFTPASVDDEDDSMTDEEVEAAEEANFEAAKEAANAAAQALEGGASVEDVAEEYDASANTPDALTVGSSLSSIYGEWLQESGRQAGDVTVIENSTSNIYVVVYQDRYRDETPTVDTRRLLVAAELTEDDPDTEEDESSTTPTDEQMADARQRAEDLLAQWEAGEATAESFGALVDEHTEENTTAVGGLFSAVYKGRFSSASPEYDEWLFAEDRQVGDTAIVESVQSGSYGYFVVYFEDWDVPVWQSSARSSLTNAALSEWEEGLLSDLTAELASGADYVG